MIRHMLACFKRFFCFDHFLTIHAYIYIYQYYQVHVPIICILTLTTSWYTIIWHTLQFCICHLNSIGLAICKFLSTHLKPATRGRIRFKIIWFFLFGLCLRHTLILWVSVNDLNYRGHLLTSTVVLQAIFSENDWPFDSMPERWRYVAWRVRVYDLGHISKKSPAKRHSAWPKFIKSFWNCFLKYWQKKGKILKKKNKITHTHTHSHAKSNMSIWLNILT